jgi:hypothetical protein
LYVTTPTIFGDAPTAPAAQNLSSLVKQRTPAKGASESEAFLLV